MGLFRPRKKMTVQVRLPLLQNYEEEDIDERAAQISEATEFFLAPRVIPTNAEALTGSPFMKEERAKKNLLKLQSQLALRFKKHKRQGTPEDAFKDNTHGAMYHEDSHRGKMLDDHHRISMRSVPPGHQGLEISEFGRRMAAVQWGDSYWWKGPGG